MYKWKNNSHLINWFSKIELYPISNYEKILLCTSFRYITKTSSVKSLRQKKKSLKCSLVKSKSKEFKTLFDSTKLECDGGKVQRGKGGLGKGV